GAMAEARGEPTLAAHYYSRALERLPQLTELRAQLVAILVLERRWDEARAQLKEMLRNGARDPVIETEYYQAAIQSARALAAAGRWPEFVDRCREALPHAPDQKERARLQNEISYTLADRLNA